MRGRVSKKISIDLFAPTGDSMEDLAIRRLNIANLCDIRSIATCVFNQNMWEKGKEGIEINLEKVKKHSDPLLLGLNFGEKENDRDPCYKESNSDNYSYRHYGGQPPYLANLIFRDFRNCKDSDSIFIRSCYIKWSHSRDALRGKSKIIIT